MTEIERLTAELTQVRTAITKAYEASEYEISSAGGSNGRRVRRQNLDMLVSREQYLERQLTRLGASVSGSGGAAYVGVPQG